MSTTRSLTTEDLGSPAQRERRRRILNATIALASHGGYGAVQMRAVAEQADVALGTLYRYFPSKVHLLVSALGRELDRAETQLARRPAALGGTPSGRVVATLGEITRGLQADANLTEALTRAFVFADASVTAEIQHVVETMSSIVLHAIDPERETPTEQDRAIARVLGDVWISSLVSWVTGRAGAGEVAAHVETTVALLLRD